MRMLGLKPKNVVCEVCQETTANPIIIGVESDVATTWPVQLCHRCGFIDIELMQLCREITIGCSGN